MSEFYSQEPMFLLTKEVLARYRISVVTLWQWRKKMGFPEPIHNGRFYSVAQLKEWDEKQLSAA